jgi:hypothetical protein
VNGEEGFVEVTHFGSTPVALDGWRVATSRGEWAIPGGITLVPGRPLILARSAEAFQHKYGTPVPVVEVAQLQWSGLRDYVRIQKGEQPVDQVAWGEGLPGWKLPQAIQAPLCRPEAGKDTNTYLDWSTAPESTPGIPGCGR